MEFCKTCGNILLPKRKTNEILCKVCNKSFAMKGKEKKKLEQYKKVTVKKTVKEDKKRIYRTVVVVAKSKTKSMTEDEREAFGELLELSGD